MRQRWEQCLDREEKKKTTFLAQHELEKEKKDATKRNPKDRNTADSMPGIGRFGAITCNSERIKLSNQMRQERS